jgi:hypothetical protein
VWHNIKPPKLSKLLLLCSKIIFRAEFNVFEEIGTYNHVMKSAIKDEVYELRLNIRRYEKFR